MQMRGKQGAMWQVPRHTELARRVPQSVILESPLQGPSPCLATKSELARRCPCVDEMEL